MHIPVPHPSRNSLQMFSGAAGLMAAFTSISLLFLLPGSGMTDALPGLLTWGRTAIVAVTAGSALVAYTLLRYSVSHEHDALQTRMEPPRSGKTR